MTLPRPGRQPFEMAGEVRPRPMFSGVRKRLPDEPRRAFFPP